MQSILVSDKQKVLVQTPPFNMLCKIADELSGPGQLKLGVSIFLRDAQPPQNIKEVGSQNPK